MRFLKPYHGKDRFFRILATKYWSFFGLSIDFNTVLQYFFQQHFVVQQLVQIKKIDSLMQFLAKRFRKAKKCETRERRRNQQIYIALLSCRSFIRSKMIAGASSGSRYPSEIIFIVERMTFFR